jgi:hypothetical protein
MSGAEAFQPSVNPQRRRQTDGHIAQDRRAFAPTSLGVPVEVTAISDLDSDLLCRTRSSPKPPVADRP